MKLKILFASSEVAPFAKTGGLGDVAGALPAELTKLGHDARVVMPYYRSVREGNFAVRDTQRTVTVPIADRLVEGRVLQGELSGSTPVYFIANGGYYDREELYRNKDGDFQDNAERFIFFSKAVLALCESVDFAPDIVHCNDWQTGLAPLILQRAGLGKPVFARTATVFTIHNLAYQGIFWHLDLPMTNLGWDVFNPEILEFYGKINLMKAGIVAADAVTTVSKKYAQEIQTPEYGCGLEGVMQARRESLFGILNGADTNEWSPEKDRWIKKRYSAQDLSGKKECRKDLLATMELSASENAPVLGIISRLADQKGLDLVQQSLEDLLAKDCVIVVLGMGEEKYHAMLQAAQAKHPQRVGLKLDFDNALAHKIEAGADMFLMPSRFEPCGLNQIYSMKYGTIPIVRATGGLDDTVQDFSETDGTGNGFKFEPYTPEALAKKVFQALRIHEQKDTWTHLMQNAMACDFSWHASALEYEKLYRATLKKKR